MNNITKKVFKQKGMKTFWTATGTSISTSAIWLYILSQMGIGEPISLIYIFILFIVGGGIVFFVHN